MSRGMRRSGAMLRLYTSPRTPADGSRRVKRASYGAPSHPTNESQHVAEEPHEPLAPQLPPSGIGLRPPGAIAQPRQTTPEWVNASPGRGVYDMQGNELRPTAGQGLVAVEPSCQPCQADGSNLPEPIAASGRWQVRPEWHARSNGTSSGFSPPSTVSVRAQATMEVAALETAERDTAFVGQLAPCDQVP